MNFYKLLQGDCLKVLPTLEAESVDLIIADPPYNIKKDKWDDINNYQDFMEKFILEVQRVLKKNGSFYLFHSEIQTLIDIMRFMRDDTDFIYKQFIVWNKRFKGSKNKGFLDGFVEVEGLRNYQQMAEYILYYTFQDETGLSKIMGSCVYPVREYIRNEIIRAKGKIVLKDVNTALGTATNGGGVASATLSIDKSVPAMITEENYLKLREWLNRGKDYEYLRKDYEDLRKDYEDLRYVFNNQKKYHSVWNFDVESSDYHVTPKPLKLIKNIILHSSKKGQLVLDPFLGTGTTMSACQHLRRSCIGIELNETYCSEIRKTVIGRTFLDRQVSYDMQLTEVINK